MASDPGDISGPPARGVRLNWYDIPAQVRAALERSLGSSVVAAESQLSGFSPGVAARLRLADGRRVFAKAVGSAPNPHAPMMHRREALVAAALPPDAPTPRLLWSLDDAETGWVALVFEEVLGRQPSQPWQAGELERVLEAMAALSAALTPSPLPAAMVGTASEEFGTRLCGWRALRDEQSALQAGLDAWSIRHLATLAALEAEAPAAVAGDTLLHFDLRADNMLLAEEQVWFVDWPLVCVGASWVDALFFAPSVTMQGGPPPEQVLMRHPAARATDPVGITAAAVAVAGFFTLRSLEPPPPGLPTLRAFQAAQGHVARAWVAERTGLA